MNHAILKKLRENETFLSFYLQGMSNLASSGIFEFLRDLGKVDLSEAPPQSVNYEAHMLALANRYQGYNMALDHLFYFRELFFEDTKAKVPEMTFGSFDAAIDKGDLTEEEKDAIRSGEPIDYTKFINPNASSSKPG